MRSLLFQKRSHHKVLMKCFKMKSARSSQRKQNSRLRKAVNHSFTRLAGPLCHETESQDRAETLRRRRNNSSTPTVPVFKPNGAVRIWGDYNITVNPQLQTEKNPLPRTDDIFSELMVGGGRSSPRLTSDRHTIRWGWRKSHKGT